MVMKERRSVRGDVGGVSHGERRSWGRRGRGGDVGGGGCR